MKQGIFKDVDVINDVIVCQKTTGVNHDSSQQKQIDMFLFMFFLDFVGLYNNLSRSFEHIWLVVSPHSKNISQIGSSFPMYGKIKNVPNHQPDIVFYKDHHMQMMQMANQDLAGHGTF